MYWHIETYLTACIHMQIEYSVFAWIQSCTLPSNWRREIKRVKTPCHFPECQMFTVFSIIIIKHWRIIFSALSRAVLFLSHNLLPCSLVCDGLEAWDSVTRKTTQRRNVSPVAASPLSYLLSMQRRGRQDHKRKKRYENLQVYLTCSHFSFFTCHRFRAECWGWGPC
jgi:hypothetical protein